MSQNESKWGEYMWEWNRMKLANPRLQWMAIFHLHGTYDNHVHSVGWSMRQGLYLRLNDFQRQIWRWEGGTIMNCLVVHVMLVSLAAIGKHRVIGLHWTTLTIHDIGDLVMTFNLWIDSHLSTNTCVHQSDCLECLARLQDVPKWIKAQPEKI